MTIGLVLLAIAAILIFFGISERFFRALGLSNWLAFLLVLALVVGAIVPNITIGGVFSLNLGGFVVPLIIMAVLIALMRRRADIFRLILGVLSVAAVAVAARMLIEPTNGGLILTSSLIVGFLGGAAAFLVGQKRLPTIASALGGIILGDIVTNFLYRFALGGYEFVLGSYGVFDSVVIAAVFSVLLFEAVSAIRRTAGTRKTTRFHTSKSGLATAESGEDEVFEVHTGDADTELELNSDNDYELLTTDPKSESFFDDLV